MSKIPAKNSPHEVVLAQHSVTGIMQWYTAEGWEFIPDEVSPAGTIKKMGWVQISEKSAPKPPEIGGKPEKEDAPDDAKAIKAVKEDKSRLSGTDLGALIGRNWPELGDVSLLTKTELTDIIKNDGVKKD